MAFPAKIKTLSDAEIHCRLYKFMARIEAMEGQRIWCFCDVCKTDFSIIQSGRDDCRRHVSTKKHVGVVKLKTENKSVSVFFKQSGSLAVICGIPENVPRFLKSVLHIPDKRRLRLASLERFARVVINFQLPEKVILEFVNISQSALAFINSPTRGSYHQHKLIVTQYVLNQWADFHKTCGDTVIGTSKRAD